MQVKARILTALGWLFLPSHHACPRGTRLPDSSTQGKFCSRESLNSITHWALFITSFSFHTMFAGSPVLPAVAVFIHLPCCAALLGVVSHPALLLMNICFQSGATMDSATAAIFIHIFWHTDVCISAGYIFRTETLGMCLLDDSKQFSRAAVPTCATANRICGYWLPHLFTNAWHWNVQWYLTGS